MRVLLLTPSVRPLGARRSLVELVRHLPADVTPMVVCPAGTGISLELKELGISQAVVPQAAWRKLGGRLKAMFLQVPRLRKVVAGFRPDVIHANEFHIVPQALFAGGRKSPVCSHVRLSITPRQIRNYRLGDCARIVAVSEAVRGLFQGTSAHERVRVVSNGVDTSAVSPEGPAHDEVEQWVLAQGKPRPLVVGLLGLVAPRKNQLVAVEAVERANRAGARVVLVIAGDPFRGTMEYGDMLRRRLESGEALQRCLWLPFQKDVARLYRSMDLNLLISSEEGFGRTIIEAGAAQRPSIGARIGGIPELIREGRTGWLVSEGSADELAGLLVEASRERERLKQMGGAAREYVEEHFTIQAHVRRMIDVWEECRALRASG